MLWRVEKNCGCGRVEGVLIMKRKAREKERGRERRVKAQAGECTRKSLPQNY